MAAKEKSEITIIKVPKEYANVLDNELTRLYEVIKSNDKYSDWAAKRVEVIQAALLAFRNPTPAVAEVSLRAVDGTDD
jgi:uncharacterized protein YfkK (UPF0435 family)